MLEFTGFWRPEVNEGCIFSDLSYLDREDLIFDCDQSLELAFHLILKLFFGELGLLMSEKSSSISSYERIYVGSFPISE